MSWVCLQQRQLLDYILHPFRILEASPKHQERIPKFNLYLVDPIVVQDLSPTNIPMLVGGFNPFEKYESNWKSSPNRDEHKEYLKPPPRMYLTSFVVYHLKGIPTYNLQESKDFVRECLIFGEIQAHPHC